MGARVNWALETPLVAPGGDDVAKRKAVGGGRARGELLREECAEGPRERVVNEGRRWDLEGKQVTLEVGKDCWIQLQEGWGSF